MEQSRGEAIPVLDPAVADAEARADDDLVAPGPHLLHLLQGSEDALRRAPTAAFRRVGVDGPDVAVEHRLEALDDVARVGETEADEVGEERGCVGRKRLGWLHGAVSFVPVVGNGGDVLPRTSTRRPAHGPAPPPGGVCATIRGQRRQSRARQGGSKN